MFWIWILYAIFSSGARKITIIGINEIVGRFIKIENIGGIEEKRAFGCVKEDLRNRRPQKVVKIRWLEIEIKIIIRTWLYRRTIKICFWANWRWKI